MSQVFISHSKRDEDIRSFFDSISAGRTIRSVRVEFDEYRPPAVEYINQEILASEAIFVLLGPNVTFNEYTINWIAYEVGVASALGKEIWVFEPFNSNISYPIPMLHHYVLYDLNNELSRSYINGIVAEFEKWPLFRRFPSGVSPVECPYENCKITFVLHSRAPSFKCPACRQVIVLEENDIVTSTGRIFS